MSLNLLKMALNLYPRESNAKALPCVISSISISQLLPDLLPIGFNPLMHPFHCLLSPIDDCFLVTCLSSWSDTITERQNYRTGKGGHVVSWNLEFEDAEDKVDALFYTFSVRPSCQFSHDGQLLSVIQNSGLKGLEIAGLKPKEDYCSLHRSNVLSPGSSDISVHRCLSLSFSSRKDRTMLLSSHDKNQSNPEIYLSLLSLATGSLKTTWKKKLNDIMDPLSSCVRDCCFSPDATIFAMILTNSTMLMFRSDDGTLIPIERCHSENDNLSSFDFNPMYNFSQLSVGFRSGILQRYHYLGHRGYMKCGLQYRPYSEQREITLNQIKFFPDGSALALAMSSAVIVIVCPQEGMTFSILNLNKEVVCNCLSIARSCQEVMACYSDNTIRVWQLSRRLCLQHICRLAILSNFTRNTIDKII